MFSGNMLPWCKRGFRSADKLLQTVGAETVKSLPLMAVLVLHTSMLHSIIRQEM